MVFAAVDGKPVMLPGFLGSEDDAKIIADVFNEREQARYKDESAAKVSARFKAPSLKETAAQLGIEWIEE